MTLTFTLTFTMTMTFTLTVNSTSCTRGVQQVLICFVLVLARVTGHPYTRSFGKFYFGAADGILVPGPGGGRGGGGGGGTGVPLWGGGQLVGLLCSRRDVPEGIPPHAYLKMIRTLH